jgi:hypothetical protein
MGQKFGDWSVSFEPPFRLISTSFDPIHRQFQRSPTRAISAAGGAFQLIRPRMIHCCLKCNGK